MTDTYTEGYTAFNSGKLIFNNPYVKGTLEYYNWQTGYRHALQGIENDG